MRRKTFLLFPVCLWLLLVSGVHAQETPLPEAIRASVDIPVNGSLTSPEFSFQGWVIDTSAGVDNGPGIDLVQIYNADTCDGTLLGEAAPSVERPDVTRILNLDPSYVNSGFMIPVEVPSGNITITTCARLTASGELVKIDTRAVYVTPMRGSIDAPIEGAIVPPVITISGWAYNTTTEEGQGTGIPTIRIYRGAGCEGNTWLQTIQSLPRQDVVNRFELDASFLNMGFSTGFKFFEPGKKTFTVCGQTGADQPYVIIAIRTVYISEVRGNVTEPLADAVVSLPVLVRGWVIVEAGEMAGPGVDLVRVYSGPECEGDVVGEVTRFTERPDVVQRLGLDPSYTSSGFQIVVTSLPPGAATLSVCARNVFTGHISIIQTISLTVAG